MGYDPCVFTGCQRGINSHTVSGIMRQMYEADAVEDGSNVFLSRRLKADDIDLESDEKRKDLVPKKIFTTISSAVSKKRRLQVLPFRNSYSSRPDKRVKLTADARGSHHIFLEYIKC